MPANWAVPAVTFSDTYANRPAFGVAKRIFQPTDGDPTPYFDTGAVWKATVPGLGLAVQAGEVAPAGVSPFTLDTVTVAGGTVTQTAIGGSLSFKATANAGGAQAIQRLRIGRSANQGCQAWFRTRLQSTASCGLFLRDSAGGKVLAFGLDSGPTGIATPSPNFFVGQFTNVTTFSTAALADNTITITNPIGLRLRNDGTNWNCEASINGTVWFLIYQQLVAAWVPSGGDQMGLYINPFGQGGGGGPASLGTCEMLIHTFDII